jgi:hypothetical protein
MPTGALFRRLPTLPRHMASWLAETDAASGLRPFSPVGKFNAKKYQCLCLAHTCDPAGWNRYSVRYCGDGDEYGTWLDELHVAKAPVATQYPGA